VSGSAKKVIAHVDCDAFYASCEAVRHPEWRGRPICVLSNHDAMVVAKSYDAKALGIRTGTPVWEARKLAPEGVFVTPDFRYYGQLSAKMFAILRRFSTVIEVYSIDEGFLDLDAVAGLSVGAYRQLADELRYAVRHEIGITVSVGISVTRTLAKMASEYNKPDGTTVVPGDRLPDFLVGIRVEDIPGIGHKRATGLARAGIETAGHFVDADADLIKRLLGRHGQQLQMELSGRSVLPIDPEPPLPKSMARTASIGSVTGSRQILSGHLGYHVMRLVAELVSRGLLAARLYLFLTLESFERRGLELRPEVPTDSLKRINHLVQQGLERLFVLGERYRGCGVVANHLQVAASVTPDLFGMMQADRRQHRMMQTVSAINRRYGRMTIAPAPVLAVKQQPRGLRFCYPLLVAYC